MVVSDAFAEAHRFKPGDSFGAVINGRWKTLVITGIALSPEFVLQVKPGGISPDFKRYGILWMSREALGTAYNMDGAFNDVVLTLLPGAEFGEVITRLDAVLDRYGGFGAVGRKDQMSHRFLTEEFRQLERFAGIFPAIFIGVAAFLLNVVISRTVSTQREQIAALKAIGYSNFAVGVHYTKLVLVIVLIGVVSGTAAGVWLGKGARRDLYGVLPLSVFRLRAQALGGCCRSRDHRGLGPSGHASGSVPGCAPSAGAGHASRAADELQENNA